MAKVYIFRKGQSLDKLTGKKELNDILDDSCLFIKDVKITIEVLS